MGVMCSVLTTHTAAAFKHDVPCGDTRATHGVSYAHQWPDCVVSAGVRIRLDV